MGAEEQGVTPGQVLPSSLPVWLWSPGDLPGSFPLGCVPVQPEEKAVEEAHAHQGWGSSDYTASLFPFQQTSINPTGCHFPGPTTCREWLGNTGAAGGQVPAQGWPPQQHLNPLPFAGSACQDLLPPCAEIPLEIPADAVPTRAAVPASGAARPQHSSVGSPHLQHAGCCHTSCGCLGPLHSLWTSGKLPQFAPVAASPVAGAWPGTQGVL